MSATVTETINKAAQAVEQHNTVENRAYAGAITGTGVAYAVSGSLICGGIGGAAGFVSYPIYYNLLGENKPKTERVAKAALLSVATSYVAPSIVFCAVSAVSTVLLGAGITVLAVGLVINTKYPELASQLAKVPTAVNKLFALAS